MKLSPRAASVGLGLVLVVVVASAALRLNGAAFAPVSMLDEAGVRLVRALHRTAASLEVLAALWLAWSAWRRRRPWLGAGIVLALTVFLALLGIVAGRSPAPAQALGNLLGGLALVAAFAWLSAEKGVRTLFSPGDASARLKRVLTPFLGALLAVQIVIGARLAIFGRAGLPTLPLHALLGLGVAALLAWLALARIRGRAGMLLFVLALAAPVAGFSALHYEYSALAALVHAASAACLAAAGAFALGRNA